MGVSTADHPMSPPNQSAIDGNSVSDVNGALDNKIVSDDSGMPDDNSVSGGDGALDDGNISDNNGAFDDDNNNNASDDDQVMEDASEDESVSDENTTPTLNQYTPEQLAAYLSLKATGHIDLSAAERRNPLLSRGRKRAIFRAWPRDPAGGVMKDIPGGKMASNGLPLWGATLFDFYRVQRIPDLPSLSTISTGSKITAWMRANGETETAAEEIAWADEEAEPKQIMPCDIGEMIRTNETRISQFRMGATMNTKGMSVPIDTGALFHPSKYPAPWPLVPFSFAHTKLQSRIPLRLLPKKLVIHDPWDLLRVEEDRRKRDADADWCSKPDIVRVYRLKLSKEGKETLKQEEAELEEECKAEKNSNTVAGEMLRPVDAKPGPIVPPLFLVIPPRPPHEPVPEAHLYLSPAHKAGSGNHSAAYYAEWELPRSLLKEEDLCKLCLSDSIVAKLAEEDGVDGSKRDPKWNEKSGMITRTEVVSPAMDVSIVDKVDPSGKGKNKVHSDGVNDKPYNFRPGSMSYMMGYEGPVRPIAPKISWSNIDCPHRANQQYPNPLTAKVRVVAKLSIERDSHLQNEAENYQKFPAHMFEHWNGFNCMPPIHDPVPVGALVPQFYGHYVPELPNSSKHGGYLSPVVLLEDCGKPISVAELDIDDRQQCASLLLRFHSAGWTHGSVYERNILRQVGPISEFPLSQMVNPQAIFRLIDFGRSCESNGAERSGEEQVAMKLFKLLHFSEI